MKELVDWENRRFAMLEELEGFSIEQRSTIKSSHTAIIGLTGTGISTMLSLVTSGLSALKVIDHLMVDESSLAQASLFNKGDLGKLKTIAIKEKLTSMRLVEKITIKNVEVRSDNIDELLNDTSLVVYASFDEGKLRLIGDYCSQTGKTLIWVTGCGFDSYLMSASNSSIKPMVERAIGSIAHKYQSDNHYPSYVSSISGGAAAAATISALLGKPSSFIRKVNVNTFETVQL